MAHRALCIGHSHLNAVMAAYKQAARRRRDLDLAFIPLHALGPEVHSLHEGELHPTLAEAIARESGKQFDAVFFWIGGSYQHQLGLLNHPTPFDFVDPERPSVLNKNAAILSYGLVRASLLSMSRHKLDLLRKLADLFSAPKYQFEAPPPIASKEHIVAHPGYAFAQLVADRGVSPLSLRLKLSRLHASIYRQVCSECGVTMLPPPPAAVDNLGALVPEAWDTDSIHASPWYGQRVLDSMGDVIKSGTGFWQRIRRTL
jgi:hypothetical protein